MLAIYPEPRYTSGVQRKEKLVNLPLDVWGALEGDAGRCRRSVTKQIEAILVAYFRMDDVEISVAGVRESVDAAVGPKERELIVRKGRKGKPEPKRKGGQG